MKMAATFITKKKSCTSDSSTAPSSPSSITALNFVNGVHPAGPGVPATTNGVVLNNGNANTQAVANGQAASESPSPGLNNNNAPKYGTPVPNRIFVGGISAQTTESELAQLFSAYGNVKATKIIVDRAGVSKGYGFVTFDTELEARRIMREAQCVIFKQRKLNIAPAIKKQPFSRSIEAQSPPIGIPSTVMYANGSPYMFHNGMAFFSPPEPAPSFQAAPASQMPTVPSAATVCPAMMYPCPPGQPLYQYPYPPVPSHMYRGGQSLQYYTVSTPVVSAESSVPAGSLYCAMDGPVMQYCEPPVTDMIPVPQVVSNNNYSNMNPLPSNSVYYPAKKVQKVEEMAKVHMKHNRMFNHPEGISSGLESYCMDEGGSGDAPSRYSAKYSGYLENEEPHGSSDNSHGGYLIDANCVVEPPAAHNYGTHQNIGLKMPLPKHMIVYQLSQPQPHSYPPFINNTTPMLVPHPNMHSMPLESSSCQDTKEYPVGKMVVSEERRKPRSVQSSGKVKMSHTRTRPSTKDINKNMKHLNI